MSEGEEIKRRRALTKLKALDGALARLPQKWWMREARKTLTKWAVLLGYRARGRQPHWADKAERRIAKIDRNAGVPPGETARLIAARTGDKVQTVARRLRSKRGG